MSPKRWVVNASPLILLGKTDNLNLLATLADSVVVPQSVANEVSAKPDGARVLEILARNSRYAIVQNEAVPPEVLAWDLGAGETQVIANALFKILCLALPPV